MRKSQIAVLSALGFVVVVLVAVAVVVRVAVSQFELGEPDAREERQAGAAQAATRDLQDFRNVRARGTWEIELVQGTEWDVDLSYAQDLEDRMEVRVEGDDLILSYQENGWRWWSFDWDSHEPATARLVMPELEELELSGGTSVELSGFDGDRLAITATGGTEIEGRDSRYDTLELTVTGAGNVDLRDVIVTDAQVTAAGASNITLGMNGGVLSGSIAGIGNVTYYGPVSDERIEIGGLASVNQRD